MIDDDYQSSNNVLGKLNARDGVLDSGVATINVSAVSVGYSGFMQIDVNHILATVANPTFEVYEYIEAGAPGYQKYLVATPRTVVDSSTGNPLYASNAELYWDSGKTGVSLILSAWHRTESTPRTFYWLLKSVSITNGNVFTP